MRLDSGASCPDTIFTAMQAQSRITIALINEKVYINDLRNISKLLKFIIFADDTNIFYFSENIKTLEKTMNDELAKLVSWFKANKLSFKYK